MYLPTTYVAALLLTILSMICWGSWANTQKLSGKWRFELFYFDFSFGVLVCAIVAALTFGSLNSQELTVFDMFSLTGKRKMAWALASGGVFNVANILLVAAISIAGMSVAFPIGIGLALVIGVFWNYLLDPQGNPALLFTGAGLVVGAIVVDAIAFRVHSRQQRKVRQAESALAGAAKAHVEPAPAAAVAERPEPQPARRESHRHSSVRPKPQTRVQGPASPTKGILLSILCGILMGSFYPLMAMAREGEDGVRPYGDALLFSIAVFGTTFVLNFFLMLIPIHGEPVSLIDYFRGTKKQHLLGIAGGLIWCTGAVANFVASSTPQSVQVGPAVSYAMGQGATMVSALWGLLVWREFAGATMRVRTLLTLMLVLFVIGLGLVSIAPLYATGR